MNTNKSLQQGMGLVEVLVALLILAVAVLGFSMLQMTAIQSTDESLIRTRAVTISNALAESMRNNVSYLAEMRGVINGSKFSIDCSKTVCTDVQKAQYTAQQAKDTALEQGINLAMIVCPGTASAQSINCLITAWEETSPTMGAAATDCVKTDGTPNRGAKCMLLELY